jgi:hypothetical protein
MDATDAYWATKLVLRFERPILKAIVAEARLSDPDAARYLLDTLVARRDATGRAFLDAVSALDDFALTSDRLCMTDLALRYGLAGPGSVEWLKGSTVTFSHTTDARGRLCVRVPAEQDYVVFRMRIRRSDGTRPAMELHFATTDRPHLIGLVRVAP